MGNLPQCSNFLSSRTGRALCYDASIVKVDTESSGILIRWQPSKLRITAMVALVLCICFGAIFKLGSSTAGWQVGMGAVGAVYALITAIQASVWLVHNRHK